MSLALMERLVVLLAILCFVLNDAYAQNSDGKSLRNQLSFTCDNNYFLFDGDDGYYTNGIFLKYDRLSEKPKKTSIKKIFSYELGQMIFTAHSRKILPNNNSLGIPYGISQIDRPIAGYLYAKASQTNFYKNDRMLQLGISVGTVGNNSLGKDAQEFWHGLIGVRGYWNWVWDYQVKNEVGANLHGLYAQSLLHSERLRFVQLTSVSQATLGTIFSNLNQSLVFQLGKFRPLASSSYWNSRLDISSDTDPKTKMEFFIYYKPTVRYQLYNATVQGGMFTSDKGPIVADIQPFVFAHEVGMQFSMPRYSIGYQFIFQSKEARGQFNRQSWASLFLAYRF